MERWMNTVNTLTKQVGPVSRPIQCPLGYADGFCPTECGGACANRYGGLAIGLPTLIALAPMLGHRLDDRKKIARRQTSDLASWFI